MQIVKVAFCLGLLLAHPGTAAAQGGISGIKISNLRVDGLDVDVDVSLQATDTCVSYNAFTTAGIRHVNSANYGCALLGPRSERQMYRAWWPLATPTSTHVANVSSGMTLLTPELNAIDWGDGDVQEQATLAIQANPVNSWKGTFSHTYANGTYEVTAGVFRRRFDTITAGIPVYAPSAQVRFWSSTWGTTYTHTTSLVGLTAHTHITVPGNIAPSDGGLADGGLADGAPMADGGPMADGAPVADGAPAADGGPTGDNTTSVGDGALAGDPLAPPSSGDSDSGCNCAASNTYSGLLILVCLAVVRRRS